MFRLACLTTALVLAACGSPDRAGSTAGGLPLGMDPDSVAAVTMLRTRELARVAGRRGSGDAASTFTAYLENGEVVFIRERVSLGGQGAAENRYFFHAGRLFLFHGEGVRAPADSLGADEVYLRLVYRGDRLAEAVKRVNGVDVPVPDAEIGSALAGLDDLVRLARTTAATSPPRSEGTARSVDLEEGGDPVRLTGALGPGDHADHTLAGRAGQTLEVMLTVPRGSARFVVRLDHRTVAEGAPGEPWSRRLEETGRYMVRVIASAGADSTQYTLELRFR